MIYIPCFQSMATRNPIEMPVRARARACVQVDMVTRFPLVPVLVRLDDFARGVNLFSRSFSLSFSLSFPPIFPVFSFFATKKINGEREYVKSAYSPAPSSCERFMRCMGTSARFSAPLSRARSPVNARAWRGQGSDDVSSSRAKLVSV